MARIGVVTWYWENYGSILQAYALQTVLREKFGLESEVIRHNYSDDQSLRLKMRFRRDGIFRTIGHYLRVSKLRFANRDVRELLASRSRQMDSFVEQRITVSPQPFKEMDPQILAERYDCYIAGGDQIWNPKMTFYSPFYWLGSMPQETPRFSYAPSLVVDSPDQLDRERVLNYLKNYKAVSVREQITADVLNDMELPIPHVEMVLDPALLLCGTDWVDHLSLGVDGNEASRPYLFSCLLHGSDEQRRFVTELARELGLEVQHYFPIEPSLIRLEASWEGNSYIYDDSPIDFLKRIRGASLIITDSFHCTAFCLLFHKNFRSLAQTHDNPLKIVRVQNILSVAGVEDALLSELHNHDVAFDWNEIDRAIDRRRENSFDYLRKALNACRTDD